LNSKKWYGVKFLKPYFKAYKSTIILAILSMAGVAITSALTAYIMKPLLNNLFIEKNEHMLYLIPFIIVLIFSARGLFRFFSAYLSEKIGIEITQDIREKLYKKVLNSKMDAIETKTLGDINTRIIETVLNLHNIIAKSIPSYLISVMTIVSLVSVILYLNWRLSLFAIVFALIVILPVKVLGKRVKKHVHSAEGFVTELNERINETFNHLDIVKVYNQTKNEESKFKEYLKEYKKALLKLVKYQELTSPIMEFFVSLSVASVVFFGGYEVINGKMSVGDFFAFLTALMMLYAPIKVVTRNSLIINMLDSYILRVESILDLEQEDSKKPLLNEPIKNISFKDSSLKIGDKDILKKLNFDIKEGETIAIVGKTGAGKSSVLSLLFGFRSPSSGDILVNNQSIKEINLNSLREQISYVNQASGIFNMSIKDNILYGLEFDEKRYKNAISNAHCEFIENLEGRDNFIVGENGKRLSGGQRQRLALARALYKDAPLFILDEATSALDANTESLIQDSLATIMNQKTTLIIAHRLQTIKQANKVIVLSEGKIVASGSYDEVSKTKEFKKNFAIE
jgi:subfamily B ATP-binding cassette protein MsbA